MSNEHELHRDGSLLLTSEDRAKGFSILCDESHCYTVLRWGKPKAWFSATVTEELIVAFLECCKEYERSDNKRAGKK